MTWRTKRGATNAIEAVRHVLQSSMPAAVTTHNAAHYATVLCRLNGSYTVPAGDKTLILTLNSETTITKTVPSGTYTAAQLVAFLARKARISIVNTGEWAFGEGGTLTLTFSGAEEAVNISLSGTMTTEDLTTALNTTELATVTSDAGYVYVEHTGTTAVTTITITASTNGVDTALGLTVGTVYSATALVNLTPEAFGLSGVAIRATTAGASYITIGAGTINRILGLVENEVWQQRDICEPACYLSQHANLTQIIPSYPAVVLRCEGADYTAIGDNDHMVRYSVIARFHESFRGADNESLSGLVYSNLLRILEVAADRLRLSTNAASGNGLVNSINITRLTVDRDIRTDGALLYAWGELACSVLVQETTS